jgi:hypothetical protein
MKSIFTHPEEIREITKHLNNSNLIAYSGGSFNYHFYNNEYYSIFQPGLGNFPEQIEVSEIRKDARGFN